MTPILAALIPGLLPAVADGIRGLFSRLTGGAGAKPANVEEQIALMRAETEKLQALAQLDAAGESYPWVHAVRALQRPAAVVLIFGAWIYTLWAGLPITTLETVGTFVELATFYLFGERAVLHGRRR